jgi:hypothetical protein
MEDGESDREREREREREKERGKRRAGVCAREVEEGKK